MIARGLALLPRLVLGEQASTLGLLLTSLHDLGGQSFSCPGLSPSRLQMMGFRTSAPGSHCESVTALCPAETQNPSSHYQL